MAPGVKGEMRMRRTAVAGLLIVLAWSPVFGGETLTNDDVIALVRAGLGAEVVKQKIATASGSYDVTSRGLIELKNAGVPDDVISAMLQASAQPRSPEPQQQVSGPLLAPSVMEGKTPIATIGGCAWALDAPGIDPWGSVSAYVSRVAWTNADREPRSFDWSALTRVCMDDGPRRTLVEFWAGDQRVMKVSDVPTLAMSNPGEAPATSFIRRLQQLKAQGLPGLQHVEFDLKCP
jgi:hypothetical protein